jgi:hypothetical protein
MPTVAMDYGLQKRELASSLLASSSRNNNDLSSLGFDLCVYLLSTKRHY